MPIQRSNDHVARGIAKLLSQFRTPQIEAWLASYLRVVQTCEDIFWEIIEGRLLSTAVGAQLDVWGIFLNFGRGVVDRNGASDDDYRAALYIRARALRSSGRPSDFDDLLTMLADLMGGTWAYDEFYPARIRITLYDVTYDPLLAAYVLTTAKAAGVALEIFFTTGPQSAIFRFAPGAVAVHQSTRGFDASVFIGQLPW